MINLNVNRVFLVGIGGIGMSALARYFAFKGCIVCGYDKTRTALCEQLEREGIIITYLDDESSIPLSFHTTAEDTLIIYTPAIPSNSVLLNYFKNGGFQLKKRAQVLGEISNNSYCIAVAGTHGKTTTSSLIAHILTHTKFGCNAFLGGILSNYKTNFLFSTNNVMVVEADEYDRSFLTLNPDIAVITSMDADHLDIYNDANDLKATFREFSQKVKQDGFLFKQANLPLENGQSYAALIEADYYADNIRVIDGAFIFNYIGKLGNIKDVKLRLPGNHNVENAVAAITVALQLGIDSEKIKLAVDEFLGVKRRFEVVLNTPDVKIIDDYAHHPDELKACFEAVRMLFPKKKMTVIFQPHLFSRTRDFVNEFAEVLSKPDQLLLLDIYPARELPIEGVTSSWLLDKVSLNQKELCKKEDVKKRIKELKPELIVIVGAGDIDTLVEPLKNLMQNA
ncbi:UDP-N-acetylmuramate--L-alanine ligase [Pedobacter flavus]|uniref:UDP-N-acetylmuramate--L-alanine ligase n=1 Tax=Pedobacter flavus TaxID=3113906 RepID=A0ABU7GXU0_9SPHI|nr:UDP-N-acetylmuramate--L-alanine ligase [Pedobacter sp. VNH31]MEE1883888.1 UDP-N-acetylmuramate--L-alanine ligase [Pedobacter sp. VNH31]